MKKIVFTFLAGIIALSTTTAFAATTIENFAKTATVTVPESTTTLVSLPFSEKMYEYISSTADMRLQYNTQEVPFFIKTNNDSVISKKDARTIPIIATTRNTQDTTYLLDAKGISSSTIFIITDSFGFRKIVDVYGSQLQDRRFERLTNRNGVVIYNEDTYNKKLSFSFRNHTYRYLKVVISNSGGTLNAPHFVVYKNTYKTIASADEHITPQFSVEQNDTNTSITLDTQTQNRAIKTIALEIPNTDFDRTMHVYASDTKDAQIYHPNSPRKKNTHYWQKIKDTQIFNKFGTSKTTLHFAPTKKRYWLFVIENNDNTPLSITHISATAQTRTLYFKNLGAGIYTLLAQPNTPITPRYDINRTVQNSDITTATQVHTTPTFSQNPSYKTPQQPLSEQAPYLFPLILLFTAAILALLLYRAFTK